MLLHMPINVTVYAEEANDNTPKLEDVQEQADNSTIYSTTPSAISPFSIVLHSGTVGTANWFLYDYGTLYVHGGAISQNSANSPWHAHNSLIEKIVFTAPITAGSSIRGLFAELPALETIENLHYINTANVTNMTQLFNNTSSITSLDLSSWETNKVVHMANMFSGTTNLIDLDLTGWDTGNVISMASMFNGASSLTNLDLSGWNTENLTNISRMFYNASSLTSVGNLSGWDTSNVDSMHRIFAGASDLVNLDLSNWDTSNVDSMYRMFSDTSSLVSIEGLYGWNTDSATNMASMFNGASSLTGLDLSGWNTENVTNTSRMFYYASSLTSVGNLSGWNTGSLEYMHRMFAGASSLINLDLSNWDTSNVANMYRLFSGTSNLESIEGLDGWDTSSATNIASMFNGASSLTSLDITNWNTGNVTLMGRMFDGASSLISLDLSGWDTSSVTAMHMMFEGTTSLESLDLSSWDTGNVTSMNRMFADAISLRKLVLGEHFEFRANPLLPSVPTGLYTGQWRNVGAGTIRAPMGAFALSSSLLMTTFDGSTMADTWVWQRSFGIIINDDHIFPSAVAEYEAQTPFIATVINIGAMHTGNLSVTLSGAHASSFILSATSLDSIAAEDSASFSVVPAVGLSVGTHTATITVTGENGISESFVISFTVYAAPIWGISLPNDHSFPAAELGYGAQTPFYVTVTNIGNQPTGILSVTLSGADVSNFVISETTLASIAVDDSTVDAFTVVPITGLAEGVYTATVVVSGDNNIIESFAVSFTVYSNDDITTAIPPLYIPDFIVNSDIGQSETARRPVNARNPIKREPSEIPYIRLYSHRIPFVDDHISYIRGFPDGSVRADQAVTRAEIGMMIFHLIDSPAKHITIASSFSDISSSSWYAQAINYLSSIGILFGYEDNTFRPNASITRAELTAVIARFDTLSDIASNAFSDVDDTHWALPYINNAHNRGWVSGYLDATFRPDNATSRAEAASIFNRVLGRIPNPLTIDYNLNGIAAFNDIDNRHWGFYQIMEAAVEHDFYFDDNGLEIWTRILLPLRRD